MSSDFASFLGHTRFDFGIRAIYINVRSIENYYSKIYGYHNQNAVFANWLRVNQNAVIAAYDHLLNARDIDISAFGDNAPREHKVRYLVRNNPNSAIMIHPLIAIIFALNISDVFCVFVISHIVGIMNKEIVNRYIALSEAHRQSGLQWQAIVHDRNMDIQRLTSQIAKLELQTQLATKNNISWFQCILKCLGLCTSKHNQNTNFDYVLFRTNTAEI